MAYIYVGFGSDLQLNDKDETVKTLEASNAEFKSRLNQTLADLDRCDTAELVSDIGVAILSRGFYGEVLSLDSRS